MSYRLRMSDEIRTWLADLRAEDADTATLVGQALTALIGEGADLGPPLVGSLAGELDPDELIEALNSAYALKLEQATALLSQATEEAAAGTGSDPWQRADVAEPRAEATAFGIRKEVLRARYVSAETRLAIDEADAEAAGQLAEVTAQIKTELAGAEAGYDGLMTLRPGAPGDGDVLIVFAVEPAGTVLLISVLEGAKVIRRNLVQAMAVSADVLRRVRAGQDPGAGEWEFADKRVFLAEFFPGSADEMAAAAAELVSRSRAQSA